MKRFSKSKTVGAGDERLGAARGKLMRYIVIFQQVVGKQCEIAYSWDQEKFEDRAAAVRHGLKTRDSDDFNIGVLRNGRLAQFCWMDEVLDYPLGEIADQIGLKAILKKRAEVQQEGSA